MVLTLSLGQFLLLNITYMTKRNERTDDLSVVSCRQNISAWGWGYTWHTPGIHMYALRRTYLKHIASSSDRPYKIGPGTHCLRICVELIRHFTEVTIIRTSRHTNISTADYYSLHSQRKLHHCVSSRTSNDSIQSPHFSGAIWHMCRPGSFSVTLKTWVEVSLRMKLT